MASSKSLDMERINEALAHLRGESAHCFYLADGDWGRDSEANAGNKARNDVEVVFRRLGFHRIAPEFDRSELLGGVAKKLLRYREYAQAINEAVRKLQDGAILFVQFPLTRHTPLFARVMREHQNRGIRFVLLLHDVEMLRFGLSSETDWKTKIRIKAEEMSALHRADCIIVHNEAMAARLTEIADIPSERMIRLGIFDYLYSGCEADAHVGANRLDPIVVAGNLSKEKAGYLYEELEDIPLALYGVDYQGGESPQIEYRGKVDPDKLPGVLKGSFGLVWDGPSKNGCTGAFGEYLRVNNPHKTSLYLAAGIPVIIWEGAALASFVRNNEVGLCVSCLQDIPAAISGLSDSAYGVMRGNAADLGAKIAVGKYVEASVLDAVQMLVNRG